LKPFYQAICVGILGVVVGASLTALFFSSSAAKQRFVFQQRQKCRELADKWTKENEPEIIG